MGIKSHSLNTKFWVRMPLYENLNLQHTYLTSGNPTLLYHY